MFCKPQARVLLVSSGTHFTCCCTLPQSHRIHCVHIQNHPCSQRQKSTLDQHACTVAVPHMQSFMIALSLISIMCIHVWLQCMYTMYVYVTLCHGCLLVADGTPEPAGSSCMSRSAAAQHAALSRGSCFSSSIFCPAYFS